MMKPDKILLVVFCLFCNLYSSQSYSIESLNKITAEYNKQGKYKEIIDINKEALNNFIVTNNTEGIFLSYLNIANYLSVQNKYKESLSNLKKADLYLEDIRDHELLSKYYGGYGRNFSHLGMYILSNNYFDKAIKEGKNIDEVGKRKERIYVGYSWKLANFKDMHLLDSVKKMEKMCLAIKPSPYLYSIISRRFLEEEKNLDSAKIYLDKASLISKKFPLQDQAIIIEYYGILYHEKKDYTTSIKYFLQCLGLYEKINNRKGIKDIYKFLSDNYDALGETEKSNFYLKKYSVINDSIIQNEKEIINIPLEKLKKDDEKTKNDLAKKLKILIVGVLVILILVVIFFVQKQSRKNKIIETKNVEKKILESKINTAFKEVMDLAKDADPNFMSRFIEVYPDFYSTLASEYPALTPKELKLCALLKLDFSTKKIAEIENSALRTIETRRYSIRQKLKLSPDTNLSIWLNNLC